MSIKTFFRSAQILLLTILLIPTSVVFATIGVGVGTGKIVVTELLKPGQIYVFPPITVLNTGDEDAIYNLRIAYHEAQPEYMPPLEWFIFGDRNFELKPGEAKTVDVRVNIPLKSTPGDYFAYLEAYPNKKTQDGSTSVGVAAAAKLYFTIVPANAIEGVYYRALSLWRLYEPWSTRITVGLGLVSTFLIAKKYLNVEINIKKASKKEESDDKKNG